MGLFRRTPKGKHALGAAVTSIPSGPLRVAAPLAAAVQPPAPLAADGPSEPSVMSSIAELIASGEAWASDLEDFHALHTPGADVSGPAAPAPAPAPVPAAVPVAHVPAAPSPLPPAHVAPPQTYAPPAPLPVQPVHVEPAPVVQAAPVPVPAAEPSARASLEAALADLLPQQSADTAPSYAAPSAPRVQLGFRDGSSASLDPESEQALALELLAQSLTRRD